MGPGAIVFVEIPVRDLARAADFYAALFGWSFEVEDGAESWYFTSGAAGPMGRITTRRPVGGPGALVFVAVEDIDATLKRAIALGAGTGEPVTSVGHDVGDYAVLIDPDGSHLGVFRNLLRGPGQQGELPETRSETEPDG